MKSMSRMLSKVLFLMGVAAMLTSLSACGGGGGDTTPANGGGGGGGGGTITSSSITLPSSVQVISAH